MSARGIPASMLCMVVACSVFGAEPTASNANRPEAKARPATTSQPASDAGAVQQAMKRLYTMPRPGATKGTAAATDPSTKTFTSRNRLATSRPADDRVMGGSAAPVYAGAPAGYRTRGGRFTQHDREFSDYRFFGGQPSLYGYGDNSFGYGYGGDDYAGEVYRFGFNQGMDYGRFYEESNARTEANLQHYADHLSRGLALFKQGNYQEASDAFRLAADTHQGDPASRLYAAHGLFAVGRYHEAVSYLRRAFELQSKIVFLTYDIRDDYGRRGDFERQLQALEKAVQSSPRNLDRLLVLGYVHYYTKQRDQAYLALNRGHQLDKKDTLVNQLMENCRPSDVMLEEANKQR